MLTGTSYGSAYYSDYLLIDMDSDGSNDFVLVQDPGSDAAYIVPIGEFDGTGKAGVIKYTDAPGPFLKTLTANYNIADTLDTAGSGYWKYGTIGPPQYFGKSNIGPFQGQGNKYIGVRFTNETGEHFGWIRVNLAASSTSINIIDWAWEDTPGTSIPAGSTTAVIPTLNEWGIIVLMTLLAGAAAWKMNKPELLQT